MGSSENTQALIDVMKFVLIIFTTLCSGAFVSMHWFSSRKCRREGPAHFLKVSLVLGSLATAILAYPVLAVAFYTDASSPPCAVQALVFSHVQYLLPFVFGVTIVLLVCDVRLRPSPFWTSHATPLSFLLPALPWALGLVIVVPLCLSDAEWHLGCFQDLTRSRRNAQVVVCVLIPAMLALLSTLVLAFKTGAATQSQGIIPSPLDALDTKVKVEETDEKRSLLDINLCSEFHSFQHSQEQQQQQQLRLPVTQTTKDPPRPFLPDPAKESKKLILFCLLYFFCVMPLTCYKLHFINSDHDLDEENIMMVDICFFISLLYPMLTHLAWIEDK